MLKAFYDKDVPTGNLITTITGILTAILSVLVFFGVITPEQSSELGSHAITVINAVIGIYGAVVAIILMFKAKDS